MCYGQGFRVAVGNPSVGEWHEGAWGRFASVLRILRPGSYLSVYEYWRNEADLEDRWLTARWTQPQIAAAIGDTEILVTECGRDAIGGRGGPWQATTWADQYLFELWRYEDLLRAFPQVKAAFVYTLGTENDAKWRHYEVGPIWACVVSMYGQPEPEPEPTGAWAVKSQLEDEFDGERWRFTVEKWEAHHDDVGGDAASG